MSDTTDDREVGSETTEEETTEAEVTEAEATEAKATEAKATEAEANGIAARYEEADGERVLTFSADGGRATVAQNIDGYAMLKVRAGPAGDELERYYGFDMALDHAAELLGVDVGDLPVPDAAADMGM